MTVYDQPDNIRFARVCRPASDARLRAMARQLAAARDEWDDDACVPRRLVLLGLARRSLPAGDQSTLVGMASEGEGDAC